MKILKRKDTLKLTNFILTNHAVERFEKRIFTDDLHNVISTCIDGFQYKDKIFIYSQGLEIRGRWDKKDNLFIVITIIPCSKYKFEKHRRTYLTKENSIYK